MGSRIENPPVAPPLYIDTTNQRVGVGTATPSKTFEVQLPTGGDVRIVSDTSNGVCGLDFREDFGSNNGARILLDGANNVFKIQTLLSGTYTDVVIFDYTGSEKDNVGIGQFPVASAKLAITSTTAGFLPPRMTTTEKGNISSPATGLVVYDTTLNKLCVYTGSAWETVTSS